MRSPGEAVGGVVRAGRPRLLLTSRRHIDLLRVCSAAHAPRVGGTAAAAG